MNFRIINGLLVPGLLVGLIGVAGQSVFQDQESEDVEIVDQDGRRVEIKLLKQQEGDSDKESDVLVRDGKIIIIDENGERREIDVSGAQNIIVNKSVRSIIRDGEEEKKITGKAIIVGPDGKKQVIELGDMDGLLELGVDGGVGGLLRVMPFMQGEMKEGQLPMTLHYETGSGNKYMIGVSCVPVSESMRSQLGLDDGNGLVVTVPPEDDSPAANAGIKQHDILTHADQQELNSLTDLVEAIQQAGKDEQELSLTLIHKGKEKAVQVTPKMRKLHSGQNTFSFGPDGKGIDLRLERFGPGMIFEKGEDLPEGLMEKLEAMEERMKLQTDELNSLQDQLRHSLDKLHDSKKRKGEDDDQAGH